MKSKMVVHIEVWPARNVAEYAYCPRLFYLMEVEGIHVGSHDTEAGQRIHKRVMREEFHLHGRQRRPPTDPVNSCLSMAYSMLTHDCVAALRTGRLEPSIGALHVSRPGRHWSWI